MIEIMPESSDNVLGVKASGLFDERRNPVFFVSTD